MTCLHLVRHGPTHAKAMTGWTDLPAELSDEGALARLEAMLPQVPVLSSDLARAVQTADALVQARLRLPPDPRMREMNFGAWEGRTHAEVDAETPALLRAFWENAGPVAAPGGESWDAMAARVADALDTSLATHPQGLIVVAHFGPILSAVRRATGETLQAVFARRIEPFSLTRINVADGVWRAEIINHLA